MKTPPSGPQKGPETGIFRRRLSPLHSRLTESTCKKCRSFVAASVRPEFLDVVERLHLCIVGSQFSSAPSITSA